MNHEQEVPEEAVIDLGEASSQIKGLEPDGREDDVTDYFI